MHPRVTNKNPFGNLNCKHDKSCSKFKTIRQRIRHHNKHEPECVKEKLTLIKLLIKLRTTLESQIKGMMKNKNVSLKTIIQNNSFKNIKQSFNSFLESNTILNKALFLSKFGYDCLDIMDY